MKTITLENGLKIHLYSPPHGDFDPLAASAAELAKSGFPPMPEDPRRRERYKRLFKKIEGRLHYVEPTFRLNADRVHGPRRRIREGVQTSTNWSGGVVNAPAGQSFKSVEADWVVPNVDAPSQKQWFYSASWIGIDGDGSNDVFQAGVECEVYHSGSSISRNIYPWWEWYPAAEVQITNLPISAGDLVTMMLLSAHGAGSATGTVYFINHTSGATTSLTLTAPSGTTLAGNCAEWIVEAPTVSGAQSSLADYGEVIFTVCEAVAVDGAVVNGGTGDTINLKDNGSIASQATILTPTVVQCEFV